MSTYKNVINHLCCLGERLHENKAFSDILSDSRCVLILSFANEPTVMFPKSGWIWDPGTNEHRLSQGNLQYSGNGKYKGN
jgi:hypothetical protein